MSKAQLVITAVILEGRSKSAAPATTRCPGNGYTSWSAGIRPTEPRRSSRVRAGHTATVAQSAPNSRSASCGCGKPWTKPVTTPAQLPSPLTWRRPGHHQNTCTVHDLGHPAPPRLCHTPTPQTAPLGLETVHRRPTQRTLASRRHPLAARRSHRGGDPQPARRPLPAGPGQPGPRSPASCRGTWGVSRCRGVAACWNHTVR